MNKATTAPRATYRLQLNKDFTFKDAEAIVPYLSNLGISHAYLSPILTARPGSTHGYDTTDHTTLNPELGTIAEFRSLARALKSRDMSIVLDIVPNHMGVGGDGNRLWLNVLEWGRESRYADWFDINWEPSEPTLTNRVLVPFLGSSYGEALADGKLELRFDERGGSFAVWAGGSHKLPVALKDYRELLPAESRATSIVVDTARELATPDQGDSLKEVLALAVRSDKALLRQVTTRVASINAEIGRKTLHELISRQHWRPARFSVAADDINYRRFFIVADLAAVRVERADVFDHVHALTFELVSEGLVDGLRVDHIDGLYDPKAYCRTLRAKCPRPIYLVVEKILAPHEALRADWGVDGTTGYEFSAAVTRLLTDASAEGALTRLYEDFTGRTEPLKDVERAAKLNIIDFEMTAELDALAARIRALAAANPKTVDFTRNAVRAALRAAIGELSVYRTYVDAGGASEADRREIAVAIARAKERTSAVDPAVFDFLENVMAGTRPASREVAAAIQQYCGPVMAKGLEDTALYRFNRLIALSDVGEKPDRFSQSIGAFHDFMKSRVLHQPHGMLSSSSHDTKRGEDVRSRIAAISGHTDLWDMSVRAWRATLGESGLPQIEPNDAYYFFQLLTGAWPAEFAHGRPIEKSKLAAFVERISGAMLKSIREARVRTNWNVPVAEYEEQVKAFVEGAFRSNKFLQAFRDFEQLIAADGAANGLIATVLKLTVPGVPDIYQGADLWEQSMVDPDNRRPVDFHRRLTLLDGLANADISAAAADFRSGAVKLLVISRLLRSRANTASLFAHGTYEPVAVEGSDSHRVMAFTRRHESRVLLVAVALGPWLGAPDASISSAVIPQGGVDILRNKPVAAGGQLGMPEDLLPGFVVMA